MYLKHFQVHLIKLLVLCRAFRSIARAINRPLNRYLIFWYKYFCSVKMRQLFLPFLNYDVRVEKINWINSISTQRVFPKFFELLFLSESILSNPTIFLPNLFSVAFSPLSDSALIWAKKKRN